MKHRWPAGFGGNSVRARLMRSFLPLILIALLLDFLVDVRLPASHGYHALLSALSAVGVGILAGIVASKIAGGIGHDIDAAKAERVRAEEALVTSEQRLHLALEAANDGLWDWRPLTDETYFSPRYYTLLGYEPDEFPACYDNWAAHLHPDDLPKAEEILNDHLARKTPGFHMEFRFRAKNGEWVWLMCRGKVVERDEEGNALRIVGTNSDITDRKRADEEIRAMNAELEQRVSQRTVQLEAVNAELISELEKRKRAGDRIKKLNDDLTRRAAELNAVNKELEAFSYSVSHDLRTPLRGIDGFSQALMEEFGDRLDEQGMDYLNRVRRASQHMARLIDDLLKLARVTQAEMRLEEVNLSALAKSIAAELRKSQPHRKVALRVQSGMSAKGDVRLLSVMMANLLDNAWKFTGNAEDAKVEFKSIQVDGKTVYRLRDNGAGFDMNYSGKLFGAFQRLHSAAEFPGTGVGLATVQRIVHRHGGKVWAEGSVGEGATFYFTLQ